MSKFGIAVVGANLLIAGSYLGTLVHAQRPPELDSTGAAYLRVNINPTEIPPMVNINPYDIVPKVEVTQMPEVRVPASGCQNFFEFAIKSLLRTFRFHASQACLS